MKKLIILILTFLLTSNVYALNIFDHPMYQMPQIKSEAQIYMEKEAKNTHFMISDTLKAMKTYYKEECVFAQNNNFMTLIQFGKYISAFNICRKDDGNSIEECIQKVEDAKLNWKNKYCPNPEKGLLFLHQIGNWSAEMHAYNIGAKIPKCSPIYPKFQFLDPESFSEKSSAHIIAFLKACSNLFSMLYPNSNFNFNDYSGYITSEDGQIYFQGGEFIYLDHLSPEGVSVQIYKNRINYKLGQNNIAIYIDRLDKKYEITEFNLPIDAQTENILLKQNKGIKITNKEIIPIVNKFFHDTIWQTSSQNFIDLLTKNSQRELFLDCLKEYLTYDNYIKTVKEPKKANETSQPSQPKKTIKKPTKEHKE